MRQTALIAAWVLALVLLLPGLAGAQMPGPVLSVEQDRFQVDGHPRFLVFVSYFDGVRAAQTAAGRARVAADLDYLRDVVGADGIRVFPNWWAFDAGAPVLDPGAPHAANDTLFGPDHPGTLRPTTLEALRALLALAAERDLLVDVTFTRETLAPVPSVAAYQTALVETARQLADARHVLFDVQNEYGRHGLTPGGRGGAGGPPPSGLRRARHGLRRGRPRYGRWTRRWW